MCLLTAGNRQMDCFSLRGAGRAVITGAYLYTSKGRFMNIVVCIKQVPDTDKVTIDRQTNRLNRAGVPSIINPFDENALELAVQLKEAHGGKVTALSMGPPQAEAALRDALAVGADEGVLLTDKKFAG